MEQSEIAEKLILGHKAFTDLIAGLSEHAYDAAPEGKWSAAQQIDHVERSVRPLVWLMSLPPFVLKWIWGKANRPSRSYEGLIEKYKNALAAGVRATGRFVPQGIPYRNRTAAIARLSRHVRRLAAQTATYDPAQMENTIIPHPALGKLTVREMMYFTVHHVNQHRDITLRNLKECGQPAVEHSAKTT